MEEAVRQAKMYLTEALKAGADVVVGHGHGPVCHFFSQQVNKQTSRQGDLHTSQQVNEFFSQQVNESTSQQADKSNLLVCSSARPLSTKKVDSFAKLQFITHFTDRYSYLDSAMMALEGGCRWIQLRMKDADEDEIERTARLILPECRRRGAVFIIDDHVELVKRVGADGVHLGKNDMPVDEARRILGDEFIIGGTANTFEDIQRLAAQGADYIGCGPFRFTTTKKNLAPMLGIEGYENIVSLMKTHGINLPIVAIGGITYDDIPRIMSTGVTGIAISGSVLRADNPVEEMRKIAIQLRVKSGVKE